MINENKKKSLQIKNKIIIQNISQKTDHQWSNHSKKFEDLTSFLINADLLQRVLQLQTGIR